jgi:hypothetical protein
MVCIHASRVHASLMEQRIFSERDRGAPGMNKSWNLELRICFKHEGQIFK